MPDNNYTAEQLEVIKVVEKGGFERWAVQGEAFREDDFLVGAMYALLAMGWQETDLPASWILGLMVGASPCGIPRQTRN